MSDRLKRELERAFADPKDAERFTKVAQDLKDAYTEFSIAPAPAPAEASGCAMKDVSNRCAWRYLEQRHATLEATVAQLVARVATLEAERATEPNPVEEHRAALRLAYDSSNPYPHRPKGDIPA